MSDSIGTQHGGSHKIELIKSLPIDEDMQKGRGHVVAKVDRYTLPCNTVSPLRFKRWHDYHISTIPRLRDFHQ